MASAPAAATLDRLRQTVARLSNHTGFAEDPGSLALGLPALDEALGGGLAKGALHELAPALPAQIGAATGFAFAVSALALAREKTRPVLVIQTDFGALEAGAPYGPGLDCFGLQMQRLVVLRVPRPVDVLWAAEEGLRSRGVAVVLAELPEAGAAADLVATQRLTMAARDGGGIGLLLRHRPSPLATAATTRWRISTSTSVPDRYGGLGPPSFDLSLDRNKRGRCGRFVVCWDHHERTFLPQAHPVGVATTASDGSAGPQQLLACIG